MSKDMEDLSNTLQKTAIREGTLIDINDDSSVTAAPTTTMPSTTPAPNTTSRQQTLDVTVKKENEQKQDEETTTTKVTNKQDTTTRQFQADMPTFDFQRFLKQMKEPSAAPIARYTMGFISAFHRREAWTVSEQVKFIQEYLNFTYVRMRECDVWRDISEKEFENAKEGLEKLVMNRLYNVTFSPSTTDDKEKDEILHHKMSIFRWIREEHLDIPVTEDNDSFLTFAVSELLKMNNYKAPRDKLICILNCCKVIFGLMKHMEGDEGADVFLPLLIYVVIRANPPRLISNVQYISRFRSPEHLRSEAGYYLTNLMGAIEFIETMDVNSLSVSQEDFDANIERTMEELEKEQPNINPSDKRQISYENAVHPSHAKKGINSKEQPLIDLGNDIAQKSMNFVEKLFSDSSASSSESEQQQQAGSSSANRRVRKHSNNHQHRSHQHHDYVPDEPSSLSQELPVPVHLNHQPPPIAASLQQQQQQIDTEQSRKEFDENLSTIVSMFPNIEPGVCFMILQASDGKLAETIESLLDMSNEQP